jgi:WD40 repeat protein
MELVIFDREIYGDIMKIQNLILFFALAIIVAHKPIPVARWNPQQNIIAITDGYSVELFDPAFQLLDSIPIFSASGNDIEIRVVDLMWSPDGAKFILQIGGNGLNEQKTPIIQIWRVTPETKLAELSHIQPAASATWSPDGLFISALHYRDTFYDMHVNIYDATDGTLVLDLMPTEIYTASFIGWHSSGTRLILDIANELQIWDIASKLPIATIPGLPLPATIKISPDGNAVAFVDGDNQKEVQVWQIDPLEPISVLQGHTKAIATLAWTRSGIVTNSFDNTTRVWDAETGDTIITVPTGLTSLTNFSPDGTKYVVTNEQSNVLIHNTFTNDLLSTLANGVIKPFVSSFNVFAAGINTGLLLPDANLTLNAPGSLIIRANTAPATVGSVVFNANGVITTDNTAPYEWVVPAVGNYTLTATPYSGANGTGTANAATTLSFVVAAPPSHAVTSLNLINADTDTSIQALTSGNTLNLGTLATRNLNIRADASGSPAKVVFTLNGVPFREDTTAPFSFGDTSGNYSGWTPDVGSYTLTATPFNASNVPGTPLTVNFSVINSPLQEGAGNSG